MTKELAIRHVADWATKQGFVDIKANVEGYPLPITYGRQQDGHSFTPDVTGLKFREKSYFELILKTGDVHNLQSKLKLLHQLTILHGGQLYLLAPKGHLPFAKAMAIGSRIIAQVVALP